MGEFKMPSLGADMEKGTLVAWNVKPGDRVKRGDIIAVVETDKGAFDTESYEEGIVERLLVEPGTKVPVGTPLALLRGDGAPAAPAPTPVPPPPTAPAPAPASAAPPIAAAGSHIHASPLARKIAAELGVDLRTIPGTGPGGVIERADVERAAAAGKPTPAPAPPSTPAPAPSDFQAGMRRAIAAAMSRSNRDIPHYYLQTRVDMTAALGWLEEENRQRPIKERLLPAVLTLKAVARALRDAPELNGFWRDDRHQPSDAIHIGFAIAIRGGGLVTPAIHDTDKKSLDELMVSLRDIIERTRSGHLRSSEMSDATITVTNIGDLGVETVFGVIYPPQVALVGLGRIAEQAWARDGMLGVHPVLNATIAGDHRATDGHRGAQFLDALNRHLQKPEAL